MSKEVKSKAAELAEKIESLSGWSAFPETEGRIGLTTREYFAAQAMTGMLASGSYRPGTDTLGEHALLAADSLIEAIVKSGQ